MRDIDRAKRDSCFNMVWSPVLLMFKNIVTDGVVFRNLPIKLTFWVLVFGFYYTLTLTLSRQGSGNWGYLRRASPLVNSQFDSVSLRGPDAIGAVAILSLAPCLVM